MNHNLFFLIGPPNASRGVNASISGPLAAAPSQARKEALDFEGELICAGTRFDSRDAAGELAILSRVGFVSTCADSTASIGRLIANAPVTGSVTFALLTVMALWLGRASVHRNLPVRPTNHSRHQRQRIEQLLVW